MLCAGAERHRDWVQCLRRGATGSARDGECPPGACGWWPPASTVPHCPALGLPFSGGVSERQAGNPQGWASAGLGGAGPELTEGRNRGSAGLQTRTEELRRGHRILLPLDRKQESSGLGEGLTEIRRPAHSPCILGSWALLHDNNNDTVSWKRMCVRYC